MAGGHPHEKEAWMFGWCVIGLMQDEIFTAVKAGKNHGMAAVLGEKGKGSQVQGR